METGANRDGRMTPQRVEEIKAFVRQTEGPSGAAIDNKIARLRECAGKLVVSEDEAKKLGRELIREVMLPNIDNDRVGELIQKGANVNVRDPEDMTALMWVSMNRKYIETLRILLNGGADANLGDKDGDTALMKATSEDNEEGVKALISHGADLDLKNKKGLTALMLAAYYDRKRVAEILIGRGADVDMKDVWGRTAIMYGSHEARGEAVEPLIRAGADVNAKTYSNFTALMMAANADRKELVEMLMRNGADINMTDNLGKKAIDHAKSDSVRDLLGRTAF